MSIVSEKKFLTEEEKSTLKDIQQKTQSLVIELGEIEMVKLQLEDRHESAKIFLKDLSIKESEFSTSLIDKYGKFTLNPETGEITKLD
jgi:hypothetical protein